MGGGIYLIQDNDKLVEMMEQAYDSEDQLQELLETYPNLLGGDQIGRGTYRRWLVISRETILGIEEDGTDRWYLDHLFLDQEAIPTLVVVKRAGSLTEVRQKMIGQMIDYAANVTLHWPVESIIALFEANCREQDRDPEQIFEEFLGTDIQEEQFWQKTKTNLQAGKVRLVFVADDIAPDTQRVVEFLNEQLDPVEVLALEIKQYVSQDGLKTLVPRVIGRTAEALQKKTSATRERRRWDEGSFFQELQSRLGMEEAKVARRIHEWAESKAPIVEVQWGTGDTYGGFVALVNQSPDCVHFLFTVDISGRMEISSHNYGSQLPFCDPDKWQELRSRLSSIGLSLPMEPAERRAPSLQLSSLHDESALGQVLETYDWIVNEIGLMVNT